MTKPRNRKQAAARRRDYIPTTVPFAATPAGETPGIGQWAHPAVWTERMLTTLLENKVKGGKWHTLIETQRWPNAYFTERGFRSLNDAHIRFVQPRGTS
jgi:hypothetical protein